MLRDRLPTVPLVLTHPQRSRRRAEREPLPCLVHVERVAVGEIVCVLLRQPLVSTWKLFPPLRVRATTTRPFTGMRCSSLTPGTNQAMSASSGCTATAKPNAAGLTVATSFQDAAPSVERKTPLWCWTQNASGSARHWTRWWGSWMLGSYWRSAGMYAARMPVARHSHVVPLSRVIHTPPHETPTVTRRASRGSTQIEWRPGSSAPPPNHSRRLGWRHSASTSCHDDPRSWERNSPPGSVPHHSVPGSVSCPASSAHTSSVLQGMGLPEFGSRSSIPSGLGGYAGVAHGSHWRPRFRERCSWTPKCPCPSATYTAPSRPPGSTTNAFSARKSARVIAQRARGRPLRRSIVKTPLRVATYKRSLIRPRAPASRRLRHRWERHHSGAPGHGSAGR